MYHEYTSNRNSLSIIAPTLDTLPTNKYNFTLQAKCCGVGESNSQSFHGSEWFKSYYNTTNQHIPVQCCKSQTVLYPYASQTDNKCTKLLLNDSYHTQVCQFHF